MKIIFHPSNTFQIELYLSTGLSLPLTLSLGGKLKVALIASFLPPSPFPESKSLQAKIIFMANSINTVQVTIGFTEVIQTISEL